MWEYGRLSFNTGLEGRLSFNMGLEGEHNQKKKEDFDLFKTKSLTNSRRHYFISFFGYKKTPSLEKHAL